MVFGNKRDLRYDSRNRASGEHLIYSFVQCITEPPEIVPFSFGEETVDEGDVAQVTCLVKRGDEPLRITWYMKGDVVTSGPSLTTNKFGTRASMLMISNVGYRHSGMYSCRATNAAGTVTESAVLKVNGNYLNIRGSVKKKFAKWLAIILKILCYNYRTTKHCSIFVRKQYD